MQAGSRPRIAGIDAARGLALLGMFVAHVVPDGDGGAADVLFSLATERSRLLFAITAGFGLGLLTGGIRPAPPGRPRRSLRVQIAIRAVLLLALGVLLTAMGPLVFVILDEYGVAFAVMIPLVFLPAGVLLGVGAPLTVLMAGLVAWAPMREAAGGPENPLADWFVTGAYPVLVWVPIMMVGVGIVRLGVDRPRVLAWTGLAGLVVAVAGLWGSVGLGGDGILTPPASDDAWTDAVGAAAFTAGNVGVGLATAAALVALTARAWEPVRRVAVAVLSPLSAAGSMPLTVYTVQLVVLRATISYDGNGIPNDDSWTTFWWLTVGTLLGAWLWRRYVGRGPLEWLVALASGRVRR